MRRKGLALVAITSIVIGTISPAWAVQLDAVVSTKAEFAKPTFTFVRTVFIEYPEGGEIADLMRGKNTTISFEADSKTPGISDLISRINSNLANDLESTVFVTDMKIQYKATVEDKGEYGTIDYKLILIPTMTNYVLFEGNGSTATIVDSQWRGISVKEPIVIKSTEYEIDINTPTALLTKEIPEVYAKLVGTKDEPFLNRHLIDASIIVSHPLSKWHNLFDPTGTIADSSKFNYTGEKIVITRFAAGESSFREGIWKAKIEEAKLDLDKKYAVRSVEAASSANIELDGFVTYTTIDEKEYFASRTGSGYEEPERPEFPVYIIYGMAGAGGAVAVMILFWSDRKLKKIKVR